MANAKRSAKAATGGTNIDSGPVKLIWVNIVPNTATGSGGGTTHRVFFQATPDPTATPLNRYFDLSEHADWASTLISAYEQDKYVSFTEGSGPPIGYSKQDSFICDDIVAPVVSLAIHTEAIDIQQG